MKMHWSATSPYVRKVMMVAIESGMDSAIELIPTNAWASEQSLTDENPLSKVPTLLLADGTVLFDSPVVAEYIDTLHAGVRLLPVSGPARWDALRQQALADGILDAAVLRRLETTLRPQEQQSPSWLARQAAAITRSLASLEAEATSLPVEQQTIGSISIACALGYLDFRFADEPWRDAHPALAAWFTTVSARDSYQRTEPPAA